MCQSRTEVPSSLISKEISTSVAISHEPCVIKAIVSRHQMVADGTTLHWQGAMAFQKRAI